MMHTVSFVLFINEPFIFVGFRCPSKTHRPTASKGVQLTHGAKVMMYIDMMAALSED